MGNATCCNEAVVSFGDPGIELGLFKGTVTALLHSRRIVGPGDRIHASQLGLNLIVDHVTPMTVADASKHHCSMGFATAEAFLLDWRARHPHRSSLERIAYLIAFHRAPSIEELPA